jgi:hypothetical protein
MADGYYPLGDEELAAIEARAASLAAMTDPDPGVRLTTGPLSAELLAAHYVHDVQRLLTEVRQARR